MTTANARTNGRGLPVQADFDIHGMRYSGLGASKNAKWVKAEPVHYKKTVLGRLLGSHGYDFLAQYIVREHGFSPTKECYRATLGQGRSKAYVIIIGGQQFRSQGRKLVSKADARKRDQIPTQNRSSVDG